MLRRAWLVVMIVAACNRPATVRRDPADVPASSPPPPASASAAPLAGYPLSRLRVASNPVEPLDFPIADAQLKTSGVRTYRALTATSPTVWLLAFEFERSADLLAAAADPRKVLPTEPPYYAKTSATGLWLLVTGFPGSKPVSPEMEAARTTFLSQWAGEE
jgi:hypothetical protein